jgi:uncharacterized protein YbjT (DUF2867 family)
MSRTVIITGATGKQGGAVLEALKSQQTTPPLEILALTRTTDSPQAQFLTQLSPNIKLLQGDLSDPTTMFTNAKALTKNPIWGVYSMQAKGPEEETQGKALIDAAIAHNVQFFVYSSVDRGDAKSSSDPTTVPHWATKHRIEKHLEQKSSGTSMRYTILRPTAFMENLSNDFMGRTMASMWQSALGDKPLQLVATRDIGWFAAQALAHPDEFAGQSISLAGAEVSYAEANLVFREKFGKDLPMTYGVVSHLVLHMVKDVNAMFKWLKKNDNGGNVLELRKMHPGLMDLGMWLEKESGFRTK